MLFIGVREPRDRAVLSHLPEVLIAVEVSSVTHLLLVVRVPEFVNNPIS